MKVSNLGALWPQAGHTLARRRDGASRTAANAVRRAPARTARAGETSVGQGLVGGRRSGVSVRTKVNLGP